MRTVMLKRYPIRVLKYFLFLAGLFIILFGIMVIFNWSSFNTLSMVMETSRKWVILAVFVGLPLVYPFFGYAAQDMRGNLGDKREVIERVLAMTGFTITENHPERIVARAKGIKRLTMMFENRIEITPEGNHFIRIEGPRREVVRLEARMRAFMNL